jgi:methyl-accepting chemotaxis protein
MAAEEKTRVNETLETLLRITEKSGNLRKDLKNDIHESVSTLWKAFNLICTQLDNVKEEYSSYRKEVKNTTNREATGGPNQTNGQVATSSDHTLQTRNNTQQIRTPTG